MKVRGDYDQDLSPQASYVAPGESRLERAKSHTCEFIFGDRRHSSLHWIQEVDNRDRLSIGIDWICSSWSIKYVPAPLNPRPSREGILQLYPRSNVAPMILVSVYCTVAICVGRAVMEDN